MERTEKICFLMSPIGDAESEIRQNADDLYELVIVPALRIYNYKVIRADKIPGPTIITNDIIQLVQNAELCVIDLTGSNPNVFYECGRRHETGKPFIQLIKKDEKLPFDVSGIRTIAYDLSTARSVHNAIEDIKLFVDELQDSEFTMSSGVSLSTLANSLERIERKISYFSSNAPLTQGPPMQPGEIIDDPFERLKLQLDPISGLQKALETGDLGLARSSLLIMEKENYKPEEIYVWCVTFASYGDKVSKRVLENVLKAESFNFLKVESFEKYLTSLYFAFTKFKEYQEAYDYMVPRLEEYFEKNPQMDLEVKFLCLDLIALCCSHVEDYSNSIKYSDQALIIKPEDIKILYDQLYYYKQLNLPKERLKIAEKMVKITDGDFEKVEYFEDIIETFIEADELEKSEKLLPIYKIKFPMYHVTFEDKILRKKSKKRIQNIENNSE